MKQTTKTLLGLLVMLVVAGAIGGAVLWTSKDEQKKTEAKDKTEKLFDFDKAQAKEIKLSRDGQVAVRLTRAEKGWKMTQPVQTGGDETAIDTLLTALAGLKQKKDLADEKDLKAYGLDKPRLEVVVILNDGKEQGVQVGIDNSFDNTLYLKTLGDPSVRVIDGYQKASLEKTAFDLRDKRVAGLDDGAEVKKLEVSGIKSPYAVEKEGSAWKLKSEPADGPVVEGIVSNVKSLRATGIAAEQAKSLKDYGLDKPSAVIKISGGADKDAFTRTIRLGEAKSGAVTKKTYAQRDDSPVVFEIDRQILVTVDKQPLDLMNKELVHVDRQQVRKLVFESASGKVEVERTKDVLPDGGTMGDENFAVLAPEKGPAKNWKISSALYAIAGLRATAFEGPVPAAKDLAKYGLDKPKTATLLGEGDKVLARVRVGAEKDGKRYALSDGFPKLVRVEKGTVDDWPWTVADALQPPPAKGQASK